jgi:hypothetical protein
METLQRVLNHGRIRVSTLSGHDLDEFLLAQIFPELTVLGHIPLQIFQMIGWQAIYLRQFSAAYWWSL